MTLHTYTLEVLYVYVHVSPLLFFMPALLLKIVGVNVRMKRIVIDECISYMVMMCTMMCLAVCKKAKIIRQVSDLNSRYKTRYKNRLITQSESFNSVFVSSSQKRFLEPYKAQFAGKAKGED